VILAVVLVPWDWVPGGALHPAREAGLFTAREIARAERFSWLQRYAGWSSYFLSIVVAVVLGFTPWGARLVRRIGGRLPWWLAVVLGSLALLAIGRLVILPFSWWSHELSVDYGLSNQSLTGWLVDYAKSLLVAWVMTAILLLVVVGMARRSPRLWFAWAGGLAVVLAFAGSFLYPVMVEPLFNNFTPMHAGPFKQSVFRLAREEGVQIDDVLVADASRRTTTINAYVSGIGGTRRVVVYDTLLKGLSPDEARVVIAHELAHAKNRDVLVGTVLGAVGSVFGVALLALLLDSAWLRRRAGDVRPGEPAVIALVLALVAVGGLLASPVENTVSRAIEARADRVSIQTTGEGKVFVRMQHQLAVHSLADPTPPWLSQFWFGSHPTVLQRAGLPRSLQEAHR
jgi:STE24 endopeptidase